MDLLTRHTASLFLKILLLSGIPVWIIFPGEAPWWAPFAAAALGAIVFQVVARMLRGRLEGRS